MFRLPLHGIRVLELAQGWAGPYAGRLLADMGAEVIKVEAASGGDRSLAFNNVNRNKYGCVLDASTARGRDHLLRLVEVSDVVIESVPGLDSQALREANDQIIVVSLTGPGENGPGAEEMSGLCHLTGYAVGPPQRMGSHYADQMAGIAAAGAAVLSLWNRRRTGQGQRVEVDRRENLIGLIGEYVLGYGMNGREPPRLGNRHRSMAPHGCYPCAGEGQWVAIACEDDAQFASLCASMGRPDLTGDSRFADVVSRHRNQDALDGIIGVWSRDMEKDEAARALQAAGVPAMPVLDLPELLADEQLRARGFFESVSHPVAGVWEIEGPHWRMSESPGHVRLPAPSLGQHNDYVFRHLLRLSDGEVDALEAEGVTGRAPDRLAQE